jgi:hypothetical protein
MARDVNTDLDFLSASRILNLPDPTAAQHPATKAYVDSALEGLAWKDSVRAATTANLNLASPGAAIDGVSLSNGDRVLVKDQSDASENGLYYWNGAASAMTRTNDASTAAELEQAVVTVEEGTTSAGTTWRQSEVNFTLGTDDVVWGAFGTSAAAASETVAGIAEIATQAETNTGTDDARIVTPAKLANYSGMVRKYSTAFGDGAATSYVITHNLNTRNVVVNVYLTGSTYDEVICEVEHTDANTVTIKTTVAPTSNQYTAVVHG